MGNVTRALSRLKIGDRVGARGPFDVADANHGGLRHHPRRREFRLRPAIYYILRTRQIRKRNLLYGARTPGDLRSPPNLTKSAQLPSKSKTVRAGRNLAGPGGRRADALLPLPDPDPLLRAHLRAEVRIRFVVFEALACGSLTGSLSRSNVT